MTKIEFTAALLASLREDGWMIAVHNDYRLNGVRHTFYLFTHPSGVWAKGEGTSDHNAIMEATAEADRRRDAAKLAGWWPSPLTTTDKEV